MSKVLVSLSGGMDSLATLHRALIDETDDTQVQPVHVQYGSKHNAYELEAAQKIVRYYRSEGGDNVAFDAPVTSGGLPRVLPLIVYNMADVFAPFKSDLLLGQGEIPEGHYEADSMRATVVPCRNLIFISVLAGLAASIGADVVYLGVHAGDHHIYPDCRPEFIFSANDTVRFATDNKVCVRAPFVYKTKADIAKFLNLYCHAPVELTRTCYKDQPVACGKCGSCTERQEAFALIGAKDPIEYEA